MEVLPPQVRARHGGSCESCEASVGITRTQIPRPTGSCLSRDHGSSRAARTDSGVDGTPWSCGVQKPNSPAPPSSPFLPCHLSPALTGTRLPQTLTLGPSQAPGTGNHSLGPPASLRDGGRRVLGRSRQPRDLQVFSFLRMTWLLHSFPTGLIFSPLHTLTRLPTHPLVPPRSTGHLGTFPSCLQILKGVWALKHPMGAPGCLRPPDPKGFPLSPVGG